MAELFQGRYRLAERQPDCGHLPRQRVTGVTLAEPAEAIALSGVRRWSGLGETIWLRAAVRRAHPAVSCHPLAVEQEGDTLLVVHPALPVVAWADRARDLAPDQLLAELAGLLGWLREGLQSGVGCGHLRLSAVRWGEHGFLASPAAWAFPLPLLVMRGYLKRPLGCLAIRGESGEPALDVALLCHDLGRLLGSLVHADRQEPRAAAGASAGAVLDRLREGLAACCAAVRAGADDVLLDRALVDLVALAEGREAVTEPAVPAAPRDPVMAAVVAHARRNDSVCLVLEGATERSLTTALAATLPSTAELTVARGMATEQPVPSPGRSPRHGGEAWLVIADGGPQPPRAARRWLERVSRQQARKVFWIGSAADSPATRLLRRDLAARWGLAVLVDPAVRTPASGGPGEREFVASPAVPLEAGARIVLGLTAVAGLDLPLPLLARAAGMHARDLGESLAPLLRTGWLRWSAGQAGWLREEWSCAVAATSAGRAAVAIDLAAVERRDDYLALLLNQLPPGRRPDHRWVRFHLLAMAGDADAVSRELMAILEASPEPDNDCVVTAACAAVLAPPLAAAVAVATRVRACQRLARIWEERGVLEEAGVAYERGAALVAPAAGHPIDPTEAAALAELAIAYADLLDKRGDFATLQSLLQRVTDVAANRVPAALFSRLQFETAWAHYRLGRHDAALEICHALLRQLDVENRPREAADVHNLVGLVRYESSRYEEARINIQKGLVLRERAGDQAAVARSCNNLGLVHLALGDLARAEACLQRSLGIKNAAGDLPGVASCLLNMAYIALHQERHELARERGEQALGISRVLALRQLDAEILLLLGEVAEARGQLAEAAAGYAEARALAEQIDDADHCLAVLRHQAGLALRQGDRQQAEATFDEAKALVDRVPSQLQRALLRQLEGDLLTNAGRHAEAAVAYEECAVALVALHKPEMQTLARARAALAHARAGSPLRARELFGELRRGTMDMRLAALPPEFHELEKQLGQTGDDARDAPANAALLRCLLGLPALEAQQLGFDAHARRIVDLVQAAEIFSVVGFTQMAPSGDEIGRWEAGESATGGARILVVRDVWPDGTEIVGTATLAEGRDSPQAPPRATEEEAQGVLALATGALAAYRARAEEGQLQRSTTVRAIGASRASAAPPGMALIGTSEALAGLRRFVDKVADLDAHVLILGENGSGKELVARLIHARSARSHESFIAVNCASIPASLLESTLFGHERGAFTDAVARRIGEFELAGAGTILLDEIGEMSVPLQAKLLRVLQEKEFRRLGGSETIRLRARVLAATNLDIERAVAEGRFRPDLYYRLAVLPIRVPSLRERPEDVALLLRHFLGVYAVEFGVPVCEIEPDALEALTAAPWRGNVRELQNLARRLLIFAEGRTIRRSDLPAAVLSAEAGREGAEESLDEAVARLVQVRAADATGPLVPRLEGLLARHMLALCGSKVAAASRLGISKPTLNEWLRRDSRAGSEAQPRQRKAEG